MKYRIALLVMFIAAPAHSYKLCTSSVPGSSERPLKRGISPNSSNSWLIRCSRKLDTQLQEWSSNLPSGANLSCRLTVDPAGLITNVTALKSSESKINSRTPVSLIRSASPFPAPPNRRTTILSVKVTRTDLELNCEDSPPVHAYKTPPPLLIRVH